jgi:hypothetical protein
MMFALFLFCLLLGSEQDALSACNSEERLKKLVNESELVLVGRVEQITTSTHSWSGPIPVKQYVRYDIGKVLKGKFHEATIEVGHYVVKNSLSADKELPQLSAQIFQPGTSLVLFIRRAPRWQRKEGKLYKLKEFEAVDSDCGVLIADENIVRLVTAIISK